MQYKSALFASATLVASSMAAYIPSEPWSTLTPSTPAPTGAITDHSADFGIAVLPISSSKKVKRNVVMKRDVVSQIGDGQIQATTSTAAATSTAQAISQIGDGQIQASTSTTTSTAAVTTAQAISQIGDGQIQATTSTVATSTTAQAISQIGDGQIQASTSTTVTSTTDAVSQITDGQIQATSTFSNSTLASTTLSTATASSTSDDNTYAVACKTNGTLSMNLNDGILTDSAGRIGSIVANRQFQFDGPPPQAGAIYAAGWSITEEGYLAIGSNDVFYQCLSGTFYNLYDESIGDQCTEIYLEVVDLIDC